MDRLIETLVTLTSYDHALEGASKLETALRVAHRNDSRVRLLTVAMWLEVPQRLIAGDAVCVLTALLVTRHFDQAAAEWAVAAWSAAVGLSAAMRVPTLAPAPCKSVGELAADIIATSVANVASRPQSNQRFSRVVRGRAA